MEIGKETTPVTISVGVASSDTLETADADTLVRAADAALYHAKNAGRNRVELATADDVTE